MREFIVDVWQEGDVWCAHSPELPLATEAKTLPKLFERAHLIAPEMALENKLIEAGDAIKLKFVFEQVVQMAA